MIHGAANVASRARRARRLTSDLVQLGSELEGLALLAQTSQAPDAAAAQPGYLYLAAELQVEHARLRMKLSRLASVGEDTWQQRC